MNPSCRYVLFSCNLLHAYDMQIAPAYQLDSQHWMAVIRYSNKTDQHLFGKFLLAQACASHTSPQSQKGQLQLMRS